MIYFFYISACLFFVIVQTVIIPYIPFLDRFYDLLVPFIIYLGLFRSVRESIPFVLFLGFIMDNLSGSPFGLYLTTYFWLFIGVRLVTQLFQVGNRILIACLVVAGVLIENLIFIMTSSLLGRGQQLPAAAIHNMLIQCAWAIFTGPPFLMLLSFTQKRVEIRFNTVFAKRKGEDNDG